MKDNLKTLKQEKSNRFFIGIAVLLTLTLCLSSCSENQKTQYQTYMSDAAKAQLTFPENSSAILYVNQRLGFSAELPLDWIGQVEIKEEYGLHHQRRELHYLLSQTDPRQRRGWILFFIDCYPGEWSEDNPPVIAGHSVVVAQTEDYTYLLRTPSDVEYSESDSALAEAYQALAAQQDFIIAHIKAIC